MSTEHPTDLFSVVHRQRACRQFSDRPVDDVLIERILDAATFAPSAENKQPWEFIVVRDAEVRRRIGGLVQKVWEGGGRDFSRSSSEAGLFAEVDAALTSGFSSAPVMIVVAGDANRALEVTLPSSIWPAVQNMLLAATALGLGSALTTIATLLADDLRDVVETPESVSPMAVIPVGYPARALGAPSREPFGDHTHRDRYGPAWHQPAGAPDEGR